MNQTAMAEFFEQAGMRRQAGFFPKTSAFGNFTKQMPEEEKEIKGFTKPEEAN